MDRVVDIMVKILCKSAGRFKMFFGSSGNTLRNQGLQVTLLQQIQIPNTEKGTRRARKNVLAGWIWPAGHTLPTRI